jgi:soluble lytic murein transglycosylase
MKVTRPFYRFFLVLIVLLGILFIQPKWVGRLVYPVSYKSDIVKQAGQNHVSPYLIAAIIRVESNFGEDKTSSRAAVGLMQLLPATADDVIARAQLGDVRADELQRPATNIAIGTAYVGLLQAQFADVTADMDEQSRIAVLATAYNAGPGTTRAWLTDGTWDGTLAHVKSIPVGETRHYVQRIVYYYDKYKKLDVFQ